MSPDFTHPENEVIQKVEALYTEGKQLADEKKFEEAAEKYTEGIQINDHYSQQLVNLYVMRACCFMQIDRYKEAIPDLEKAIEMESGFSQTDYYLNLGRCHEELGDIQKALIYYEKSIEVSPGIPDAYFFSGLINYYNENFSKALSDIERLIDLNPNSSAQVYDIRNIIVNKLGLKPIDDEDPEIFPGQSISKMSDYVAFMKKLETGDISGALTSYGLDMIQYSKVTQQWRSRLATDQSLTSKFLAMMAT